MKQVVLLKTIGGKKLCLGALLVLSSWVFTCGCGLMQANPMTSLRIKAGKKIGGGGVCYLLVRTVSDKDFLLETYPEVSNLVFSDSGNESVIANIMMLPGEKRKVKFASPLKDRVGIYCLCSEPGKQWKILLPTPLKKKYTIMLDDDEVALKQ